MKRLIAFVLMIAALFALCAAACAEEDYSFLDGMSVEQLEALKKEIDKRIASAKSGAADADPENLGMWVLRWYVDEFKLPTDKGYITNSLYINGTFSNSATTDSKLKVAVLVDYENDVSIFLYEYGDNRVKNSSSKNREYYTVTMMDNDGTRHSMKGYIFAGGDRLNFDDEDEATIIEALSANGTVRFSIKEDDGMSSYLFAITDTSYFSNAYAKLNIGD